MLSPSAAEVMLGNKINSLLVEARDKNHNTQIWYEKTFKEKTKLEDRIVQAAETRKRYPTKLPVVIERYRGESHLGQIDKAKWLVPHEMNVMQLSGVLKQRLNLPQSQEFFLLINGRVIPSQLAPISSLHKTYADIDGFLYFSYASQECFG